MKRTRKIILSLTIVLLLSNSLSAQTENEFLQKIESLQQQMDDAGALAEANKAVAKYPNSFKLLVQQTLLNCTLSLDEKDEQKQKEHIKKASQISESLLKNFSKESMSYTARAVSLGCMALTESAKGKIDYALKIKENIDKALALDPNSFFAWHVLGRWSYEMASLGKVERFFAGVVYKPLPQATMADAIKYLYKSYTLKRDFIPNHFFLAEAYRKNGNKTEQKKFLQSGTTITPENSTDLRLKNEMAKTLK